MVDIQIREVLKLTKPGIVIMVLVTTALAYVLASKGGIVWDRFFWTILGTGLTAAGGSTFNHYLEREWDKLMPRTKRRPLVTGTLTPNFALIFGTVITLFGVGLLALQVNYVTAVLAAATFVIYVFIYTPLKRKTHWNTAVGAVSGALPPVGGWTAVTGHIDLAAIVLFLILFVWQHPHFYAIAWLYKDDYSRAGYQMLPVVDDANMTRTARQVLLFSLLLVPVSILPLALGLLKTNLYLLGALIFSITMLSSAVAFSQDQNRGSARALLLTSLLYLPAIFLFVILDLVVLALVP